MQKISTFLWFDTKAEEAAEFYTSIFKNSKITSKTLYQADTPSHLPVGSVMTVSFELEGQEFTALNGGLVFKFNESISFVVKCKTQEEIDYYWEKLGEGGDENAKQCGWLKDKFGVSWQIIPENIGDLVNDEKSTEVMLKMKKIIIKDLENA
ncbi:MAG: VOC family protein [Patescibacteria group bacterium]|nr:VOC family protein [Patescibacteria group bacterium]